MYDFDHHPLLEHRNRIEGELAFDHSPYSFELVFGNRSGFAFDGDDVRDRALNGESSSADLDANRRRRRSGWQRESAQRRVFEPRFQRRRDRIDDRADDRRRRVA